jgi:hypothetical protein
MRQQEQHKEELDMHILQEQRRIRRNLQITCSQRSKRQSHVPIVDVSSMPSLWSHRSKRAHAQILQEIHQLKENCILEWRKMNIFLQSNQFMSVKDFLINFSIFS